jgi:hypothetical protein
MDKLTRVCLISILLISTFPAAQGSDPANKAKGYVPPNGFVPTAETAIAVAEAVLEPVYGKDQIASERPFKAVLNGNVWVITGSVPCHNPPPGAECPGGAAEIRISKRTGQVLFMTHYE